MYTITEYVTQRGRSPFKRWFDRLPAEQASRIDRALSQMAVGNLGDVRHVGGHVLEYRIHSGPGFRIYFGRDGRDLVILLIGGDKSSQTRDIRRAKEYWNDYLERGLSQRSET